MVHILVIGSPSLDTIYIGETIHKSVGGAGMYVAMGARRSDARVSLFGPRPVELPEEMKEFASRLEAWIGPLIPVDEIPQFEISHGGEKADYLKASLDSESDIDMDLLPDDLSIYDAVHITAMGDSGVQKAFLENCQNRGARLISMGTWLNSINKKPEVTKGLVEKADVFFMNEEEATVLFGSLESVQARAGQVLLITRAEKGAFVFQGEYRTTVPAVDVELIDPTGAGESFCGAALTSLLQGDHPVRAAQKAMIIASEKVADVGANGLFKESSPIEIPLDKRIRLDIQQIEVVSDVVRDLPDADPFSFVSDYLPPIGNPHALDYFFAVTLQQFGFWEDENGVYTKPLIADIDGVKRKGSTYMYYAFMRPLIDDPEFYSPERQAALTIDELGEIFKDDDGVVQMPALEMHVNIANQYGHDMQSLGLSPRSFILKAMRSQTPLRTFIEMLDHVAGYKEDPVRKKSDLLALSLSQRPEQFLKFGAGETVSPVVDYHCMRSILRIGLVDVLDDDLREKITNRQLLQPDEEWAIRYAGYKIQELVEQRSGKPIGAVDWFFFNYMRSHCPEMTDPDCSACALDKVCAKRKEMFQPVIRTTFY